MMLHLVLFTVLIPTSAWALYQSYGIRGKFFCGAKAASGLRVRLGELDRGMEPSDILDEGVTDGDGRFELAGGTAELTRIEPILVVAHDCDDESEPGHRVTRFLLPPFYITNGRRALKVFDIGAVNLETIFINEAREEDRDEEAKTKKKKVVQQMT